MSANPKDPPDAGSPGVSRKSVLSVLGNWLMGLVAFWIYPVGPILGLIILGALDHHWFDGFQKQHPAISGLLSVFALASIFAHIALGAWVSRDWRKNRDAYAAARAKELAEFIQAMQEVSYWLDCTTKTEGGLGAISAEVMTIAHQLARKRVEQEISNKGFKIRDVSLSEIKNAAKALMTAQRPQMIEQARARLEQMKARGFRSRSP
jgi:hypothetical protein